MFKQLQIKNLRLLRDLLIEPSTGFNFIYGSNGAGKTSLLEAIYVLVYGRSFRHREILPLISEGQNELQIFARFCSAIQSEHQLGMQRTKKDLMIRLDGKSSVRRSQILNLLPVTWIGSDPQLLLVSGPEKRRVFLDTGLFHMEHHYLTQLQKYHRALDQRNAALKSVADTANAWDKAMDEAANKIDRWRVQYVLDLTQKVLSYMESWNQSVILDIQYQRGWSSNVSLLEALRASFEADKKMKHTTIGVHRADILVRSKAIKSGNFLSQGQLKMLACAFYFAQMKLLKQKHNLLTILLFDDLSAELDTQNRRYLLNAVTELYDQSFVTALNREDICLLKKPDKMFHVEQGRLEVCQAC